MLRHAADAGIMAALDVPKLKAQPALMGDSNDA